MNIKNTSLENLVKRELDDAYIYHGNDIPVNHIPEKLRLDPIVCPIGKLWDLFEDYAEEMTDDEDRELWKRITDPEDDLFVFDGSKDWTEIEELILSHPLTHP
jgi:hypothetical protein